MANNAGDILFDTANTSWSVSTNFTVIAAPLNSSTTDRKGQHCCVRCLELTTASNFLNAMVCLPAVVVLDKAIIYASVYENVSSTCMSGGVCCGNSSATLLAANATAYTAFDLGLHQAYRQVTEYQTVKQSLIQYMSLYGECILCYCCRMCIYGLNCSSHAWSDPLATSATFSTVRDLLK